MKSALLNLKNLLHDRFPEAMRAASGARRFEAVEPVLQPRKLVEIVGLDAGPLLRCFIGEQRCALIDGADAFDPVTLETRALNQLLWVRCQKAAEAVRAADLLLRDGNLRVVLVDLRLLPARELFALPSSVWHRLHLLAEHSGAAVAVFSPCKVVPCIAGRWTAPSTETLQALMLAS